MLQRNAQRFACSGGRGLMLAAAACGAAIILSGCSGGGDASTQSNGAAGPGKTGTSGGPGTAQLPSGGGPGPSLAGPGMRAPGSGAGEPAVIASKPPTDTTMPAHRGDPFKPWWPTAAPPPNPLSVVEPVRIAIYNTAAETKPPGVEIQEVPTRRVAGILTGNGVYALLDNYGGGGEVVKPGQVLQDGYRVDAINANSVVLKRTVDNRTYTQVVPLTDAGSVTQYAAPAGARGGPGMAGMSGAPGGMSGRPRQGMIPGAGGGGLGGK